jgi:8-oxo-dGTP pyrophosphatase MutT (NUDIX family)
VTAVPSRPDGVTPGWVRHLVDSTSGARGQQLSRFTPPPGHARRSAVLILFAERAPLAGGGVGPDRRRTRPDAVPDLDVLLTERASTLRSHAGQVAFPGGRIDPGDAGPGGAALREAQEETGLDPRGVRVVAQLAEVYLPPSDYAVTPVLGWWHTPTPVAVIDPAEVARVVRVPMAELVDPGNRFRAVHPSGFTGPAFSAGGLFVWGFTAGLLDRVLSLTGWERPWDHERLQDVPLVPDPPRDRSARA